MKKGCAISLLFLAGGYFAGSQLLARTTIQDQYWVPYVYGIGLMLVFLNAWGLVQTLQKKRAAMRQASEWKTGDLVVLSGSIHAQAQALIAPFSKQQAVMVEYTIKSEDSTSSNLYFGFLMAPCMLRSTQGSQALLGFQMLPEFSKQILFDQTAFPNAIEFVRRTKFKPIAGNPKTVASELMAILKKDDGEVNANYAEAGARFLETMQEQQADKVKGLNPYRGFTLEEKLIANGAAVTISGSYDAVTNSIHIGDSLTNPDHTIALGASAVTSNRPLVVAILYTVVCTLALAAASYFLLTLAKR